MMAMKARILFLFAIFALADVFNTVQALKGGVYTISNVGVPKTCKKGSYLNSNKCKAKKMPLELALSGDSNTWEINVDKRTGLASIRAACGNARGAHMTAEIINCDGNVLFLESGQRFVWLLKKTKDGLYTIQFSNHWGNYDGACADIFLGVDGKGCGSLGIMSKSGKKILWKLEKPKVEKPKPKPKPKPKKPTPKAKKPTPKPPTPDPIPPPPAPTCTDGIQNGSESDVDCGGSCPTKCAEAKVCNVNTDCAKKYCASKICNAPPLLQGSYVKTSDNQCWYMVLQYYHLGGTSPALVLKQSTEVPPVVSSTLAFGDDGSTDPESWGHLSNAAMAALNVWMPYSKLRFYCTSSTHGRVVHFETSTTTLLDYFKTGYGSGYPLPQYVTFPDHTALHIPNAIDASMGNSLDAAMTEFPIYKGGTGHWGINDSANSRWECDEAYTAGSPQNTFHQIYVDAPSEKCA